MSSETLHVVFTPSGAGALRDALAAEGRDDRVVSLFDNLSFGPIDSSDGSTRPAWVEEQLGYTGWDEVLAESEPFWRESLAPGPRKIVWMSRRATMEYTGFLEWLRRAGDAPCEIVDLTDCRISRHSQHGPPTRPHLAVSLAGLFPDEIRDNKLLERAEPLAASERHRYQALWQQLRRENAPFRVTDGQKLTSAPISVFDQSLLSHVRERWLKVARVVAETMALQMDDRVYQVGDMVLAGRINALVNDGVLECQGNTPLDMRFSEVRLPQRIDSPPTAATG